MTLIVEDGTGVSGANAYVTATEVTSYLTDRNRQTENLWSTVGTGPQEGAIIEATDFIEQRWGLRFKGARFYTDISAARATLTLSGQPLNTETVTIGTTTYTFNTSLGGAFSVLIGVSAAASLDNLVSAIGAVATAIGTTVGTGTTLHPDVSATAELGDTLLAVAKVKGTPGNGIVSTETLTNGSWSSVVLLGGGDVLVPQPLSFPRQLLFDRDGLIVSGIPLKLKFATIEYTVRAVSVTTTLMPDPTVDDSGRTIVAKRSKLGPIEEEFRFEEGGALSQLLRAYPAADRLLSEYVTTGGRVFRG